MCWSRVLCHPTWGTVCMCGVRLDIIIHTRANGTASIQRTGVWYGCSWTLHSHSLFPHLPSSILTHSQPLIPASSHLPLGLSFPAFARKPQPGSEPPVTPPPWPSVLLLRPLHSQSYWIVISSNISWPLILEIVSSMTVEIVLFTTTSHPVPRAWHIRDVLVSTFWMVEKSPSVVDKHVLIPKVSSVSLVPLSTTSHCDLLCALFDKTPEWLDSDSCQKCDQPFFWNFKQMWDCKKIGLRQVIRILHQNAVVWK